MFYNALRPTMFTEEKVAQMAAFFLDKNGGKLGHLKLIKLLYLSDRQCLIDTGYPMTDDDMYSLPNGPILSDTLDLINGRAKQATQWSAWVTPTNQNKEVTLSRQFKSYDLLDELSLAEIDILEKVYQDFGQLTSNQLITYTHSKECPEWTKPPQNSRVPIQYHEIFEAAGFNSFDAMEQQKEIEAQQNMDRLLA